MEPSINEIMLKSLKELDLSAAICAKQAKATKIMNWIMRYKEA